jgi:hypothetical protein
MLFQHDTTAKFNTTAKKKRIKFLLFLMLSRECRASLTKFLQLLEEVYGPHLDMENFDSFEKRWHEAVCMIERDFRVCWSVTTIFITMNLSSVIYYYMYI